MKQCISGRGVPLAVALMAGAAHGQCWQPVWSSEFATMSHGLASGPMTIAVFDADGPGPGTPALFVGGSFTSAGGQPIARLAKRDLSQWSSVGTFNGNGVRGLGVHDFDGDGPQPERLFQAVDWIPGLYRWGGGGWEVVGGGLRSALHTCVALRVIHEDGPGSARPVLFAGGYFTMAGQVSTPGVARWDGQEWSSVGSGIGAQVEDIIAVDFTLGQ